jgi:long-chain acyl-CoA synthetase
MIITQSPTQTKEADDGIFHSKFDVKIPGLPEDANTTAKLFLKTAAQYNDRVAMRKKRFGIWQEYTWAQSLDQVKHFCLGLVSLGLQRGDKICIIGENDPESYWAEYAAHAAGATSVCVFTDATPPELEYIITNSDASFLIAHDQEQCDKALELKANIPNVRKVIYWEERGLWDYDDPWLMSFEDVVDLGREYDREHPGEFEEMVSAGRAEDIAILSYTSGTTSLPKGAMISHGNLVYQRHQLENVVPSYPTDNYVSFSPLAWITEQGFGISSHVYFGFTVNFPESPETVQHDIREIAPSQLLFPSRIWENLARIIQMRVSDSTWVNRALFKLFLPVAYRIIDLEDQRKSIPLHLRLARWLGEYAVLHPLRDKIGMTNMRDAFTSGSVLSPDVLRFFRALGVELRSIYGSTEMQAATMHFRHRVKLASVGEIVPNVEIKIASDDEIRVRSGAVFQGYYKAADKTAEAFDEDSFFMTGDAGYMDKDGHLIYLDRLKDMIELTEGHRFSPQYIEGRLKFSQYIQDVMAVGGYGMPFVTAIVTIDFDNVARWAEKNRVHFTTYVDLTQKPEVYRIVHEEISQVNESLPETARIKKFTILHKAFDADEAELTRTRKLRRRALAQRYSDILDAMYGNRDEVRVSADVKYRDGRTGTVETAVRVMTVE